MKKTSKKTPKKRFLLKGYFPILSGLIIAGTVIFAFYRISSDRPQHMAKVVHSDLESLYKIFKSIDNRCNILSIKTDRSSINFLTVKEFAGSEVGFLNLAHPKAWQGPYLEANLSVRGTLYDIIRASDGFYIVPGQLVKLPNNSIMGRDLVIDRKTNMTTLMAKDGKLNYKGQLFARKLDFNIGDWDFAPGKKEKLEKIDMSLKEFNEAIPYTYHTSTGEVRV